MNKDTAKAWIKAPGSSDEVMERHSVIQRVFRRFQLRFTYRRAEVFVVMARLGGEGATCKGIVQALRAAGRQDIGESTVYRVILDFVEAGLSTKLCGQDRRTYYRIAV